MTERIARILAAMRADCIPCGKSSIWTVNRRVIDERRRQVMLGLMRRGKIDAVPPIGSYTFLWCMNLSTMHLATRWNPGECVMNDFPSELRKHLQFVLRARGRVLVTGLGLGCVVRGLLAAGRCSEIHVVERSPDVIKLVWPRVASAGVTLHEMDALAELPSGEFDYAWHDLHSGDGEPHLQVTHLQLVNRLMGRVKRQGAWAMRRLDARLLREAGIVL